MYRKMKSFTPDSSWDIVFADGTVRPMAGWSHLETYSDDGEHIIDRDEIVGAFILYDESPYLTNLVDYLEQHYDDYYGDFGHYVRHDNNKVG